MYFECRAVRVVDEAQVRVVPEVCMAADSGAALFKKLQIKQGMRLAVLHAPPEFEKLLAKLPDGVERSGAVRGEFDVIHLFATERRAACSEAPKLAKALRPGGILWVSYPKGKRIVTDSQS